MADETLDYLGRPAPLSIQERPGLPLPTVPAPSAGPPAGPTVDASGSAVAGTPTFDGDGGSFAPEFAPEQGPGFAPDAAGFAPEYAFMPDTFASDPTTGIASRVAGPATSSLELTGAEDPASQAGGLSLLALIKGLAGAEGGVQKIAQLLKDMGLGVDVQTSVLAPSDFALAGQSPGSVLEDASDFNLSDAAGPESGIPSDRLTLGRQSVNAGDLPRALKDLPLFLGETQFPAGAFTFNAEAPEFALNPADFDLGGGGDSAASVLNPSDYTLGADTSIDAGISGSTPIPWVGPAVAIANAIASAAMNGTKDLGGAAVRGAIDAVGALAQSTHPLMGLWNLPQLAYNLEQLFEGGAHAKESAERTRQGQELAGEVLGPIGEVFKGTSGLRDVLARQVGGSTIGDALASILNFTGEGSRPDLYGLPDPTLKQLQTALMGAGYGGTRAEDGGIVRAEPEKGRVGGVGEMIAAMQGPERFNAVLRALSEGVTGQSINAPTPADAFYSIGAGIFPATGGDSGEGFTQGASQMAELGRFEAEPAWYRERRMANDVNPGYIPVDVNNIRDYTDYLAAGAGGSNTPYIDPTYLRALRAIDPAAADRLAVFYRAQEINANLGRQQGYDVGGGE